MTPLGYRWEHAVNSAALVARVREQIQAASAREFCDNDFVNAIEADIIWSERQHAPVMGHPPQTDGDLTLEAFLTGMRSLAALFVAHDNGETPLIVKLDFKSTKAFEGGYDLVRAFVSAFPFARGVFVNADILVGPANTTEVHFDAVEFLRSAAALGTADGSNEHKIVLSVGWTTSNATEEEFHRPYTAEMIDEMIQVLRPYEHLHVTFPLRATTCRASWNVIKKLLTGPPTYGFTLWWAKTQMSDKEIEWLFHTLEEARDSESGTTFANRTFYDILGFDAFLARRK